MKAVLPLILIFASCTASNVVQTGPNTYMVAKSSVAGAFANTSKLKIGAIEEANRFAAKQGKVAVGIGADERRPAIGGFPSYEYRFTLADP